MGLFNRKKKSAEVDPDAPEGESFGARMMRRPGKYVDNFYLAGSRVAGVLEQPY